MSLTYINIHTHQVSIAACLRVFSPFGQCLTSRISGLWLLFAFLLVQACGTAEPPTHEEASEHEEEHAGVHLSDLKFKSLGMQLDTLTVRTLTDLVAASGQLEVPPQYEATVTTILGANVSAIHVIEGDKVSKGQVLAYISHPELTQLQSKYLSAYHQLTFLSKEYDRAKTLNAQNVNARKSLESTTAAYHAMKAEVSGMEMQLAQINLNVKQIQEGKLYEKVPVKSPIDGYVEDIAVRIGEYVSPREASMFAIVNNDHVHADLMVFEKDVTKVKVDQKVRFSLTAAPEKSYVATIISVGKRFEENPKAIHVHAELDENESHAEELLPGMYIAGKIATSDTQVLALPTAAIVSEEGQDYVFTGTQEADEWEFTPIPVLTGVTDGSWTEIKLMEPMPKGALVAYNNAYFLMAEMKKGSTEHHH